MQYLLPHYFLGIDGGGTKTRAVLIDDTLRVIGRGTADASNHYAVGAELAAHHCAQAAQLALTDAMRANAQLNWNTIAGWGFGLAGVRRQEDALLMSKQLDNVCGGAPWVLETDAVAAHYGAFNGGAGIIQIAGTGAICLGIDEEEERFYTDGWGPLLGDEGSAYWIGQQALQIACRSADGRVPKSPLTGVVLGALSLPDCNDLPLFLRENTSRQTIAGLAQFVFDAAMGGVSEAIAIREEATLLLSRSIAATARRILKRHKERHFGAADLLSIPIVLSGGLFEDNYFKASLGFQISQRFEEIKDEFLPIHNWRILKPQFDAACGAAMIAMNIAERQI